MTGHAHLYIPGPTNVPETVRMAMNVQMEDQRSAEFPFLTLPIFQDLKTLFRNSGGHVFIYPSSGTGAWEAAITNVLSPGDRVLMSSFGQFSVLWIDMARRLGLEVVEVECDWGTGVPVDQYEEILRADQQHQIKAVFVTHNETSTGVTSDILEVRRAMNSAAHPAMLFVDGVSSVASIDLRQDDWGIDCAVSGSQKGLMLPPGLGFLSVSAKALEASKQARHVRCYFSFDDMLRTNAAGYFPYTPPIQLLHGLRASLDLIAQEGLENVFRRHARLAEGVRCAVRAWGLQLCAKEQKWQSDTVSAIVVPEGIDSGRLVSLAAERYRTAFGAGLHKVAGRVFRIGHLGSLNEVMICAALASAEMSLMDCGLKLDAGSGVGAAIDFFREEHVTCPQ